MPTRNFRTRMTKTTGVIFGAVLAGCTNQAPWNLSAIADPRATSQVGTLEESLAELGLKRERVVEIDASGIVGKHSSKFRGTVAAPPGIVAKNSSKYRIQAYVEIPLEGMLVFLTTVDERLFVSAGRPAMVRTDFRGVFDFGSLVLPAGTDVIVHARPPGQVRELVAYTASAQGENVLAVGLASTLTARFLLDEAHRHGQPPSRFAVSGLPAIQHQTQAILEREDLVISPGDLAEGGEGNLKRAYFDAMASKAPALLQAWRDLLGFEPVRPGIPRSETAEGILEGQEGGI